MNRAMPSNVNEIMAKVLNSMLDEGKMNELREQYGELNVAVAAEQCIDQKMFSGNISFVSTLTGNYSIVIPNGRVELSDTGRAFLEQYQDMP